VSNGSGPVTIYLVGSCGGLDQRLIASLNQTIQKFLSHFPKTIAYLNELLDKKNVELNDKVHQVSQWTAKYRELSQLLEGRAKNDELSNKVALALDEGDLKGAEGFLKQLLKNQEIDVEQAARSHSSLAEVYELQFQPTLALAEYELAYRYRPLEFKYIHDYAVRLWAYGGAVEAEPLLVEALRVGRKLAGADAKRYAVGVSAVLSNLGQIYATSERFRDAEAMLKESVDIAQRLAKDNVLYLPAVAGGMSGLGILYSRMRRWQEAESNCIGALAAFRRLDELDTGAHRVSIAIELTHLGNIYGETQRLEKAELVYKESLAILRPMAIEEPTKHRNNLTIPLSNLGNLYFVTRRFELAEDIYNESLKIYQEQAETSQNKIGGIPRTLVALGATYRMTLRFKQAEDAFEKGLPVYRELATANPKGYLSELALALRQAGDLYIDLHRPSAAIAVLNESIGIYRRLAEDNPAVHISSIAATLQTLGMLYVDQTRFEDAQMVLDECLTIRTTLAEQSPATHLPSLIQVLEHQRRLHAGAKHKSEVRTKQEQILAAWRRLVGLNNAEHGDAFSMKLIGMTLIPDGEDTNARVCAWAEEAIQVANSSRLRSLAVQTKAGVCPSIKD